MEAHLIEHDKEPHCEDKEREYKSDNNTDNEGTYHYSDEDFDENDNNSDNEGKYNFPDEEPPQTPEEARPAALSSNLKLASHQDRAGSKDGPSVKKTKFTKNFEASHASYYNKSPNKYKEPLLNHITESPTQEERESIDLLEASKIIKNSKKRSREEYEHDEDKSADGKAEETQTLQKFGVWSRRLNKDITQGQKLKGKDVLKLSKLGSDFTRYAHVTNLKPRTESSLRRS